MWVVKKSLKCPMNLLSKVVKHLVHSIECQEVGESFIVNLTMCLYKKFRVDI